ncbi:MAG: tetratricopeptide repeat protein [Bacteroidaceae bacterium]|jgi:regulator of sirC expression with transglutaminase-like and TPR domain|nr:tetratricopeptide repeat protein [Bacteroidaceae bacterium]
MTKQDPLQLLADLTLRLQEEPDNADLLMQRGQLRYQMGDKNGSWQDLQRALELKPALMATISGEAKTPERKVFKMPKN